MADEFDRAQEYAERELALNLAEQARRAATTPGDYCRECGEDLADHRKPYGICIHCKTAEEAQAKHHQRGAR